MHNGKASGHGLKRCTINPEHVKELTSDSTCIFGSRGQAVGMTAMDAEAEVKAADFCVGNAIPSQVPGGAAWY